MENHRPDGLKSSTITMSGTYAGGPVAPSLPEPAEPWQARRPQSMPACVFHD
jgi:hypothetical protein